MPIPDPIVILTRPLAQSRRFADQLIKALRSKARQCPRILVSPLLSIEPRPGAVDLENVAAVILTSENAVTALAGRAEVAGLRAFCVGDRTATAAAAAGMRAVSASGDADALVAMLIAKAPTGRLLHLHGAETRGNVVARLKGAGLAAEARVVYDQVARPLTGEAMTALAGETPVILPLFSPRTAMLAAHAAADARAPLILAFLSPAVASAWDGPQPLRKIVATRPDGAAICEVVSAVLPAASP